MRRLGYAKYAVTLLALTVLTFHLLQSRESIPVKVNQEGDAPTENIIERYLSQVNQGFTKSKSYLLRKLTQGNPTGVSYHHEPPKWVILPGNVTVHVGNELIPQDVFYEINAESICDTYEETRLKLLVFVASKVDHFAQRKAIRETWGLKLLQDAYNYRIVFLLGQSVDTVHDLVLEEGFRYGDLVQINLTETFRNLGRKSVAGLQWSKDFCRNADYVMKTDDDLLIHIPNLLQAVRASPHPETLLLCHENRMRKILRKSQIDEASLPPSYSKYEVSENELPGGFYPPYCSGMAYLLSSSVRDRILQASQSTPIFFIEDVYLTGFCRHKAGILMTPHPGISLRPPIEFHQASCSFRDGRITSQEVGAEELRRLWAELNTQGFFCPQLLGYARKRPKEFSKSVSKLRTPSDMISS